MANFEWALAQLKQGKKVRQAAWPNRQYIYKYCGDIFNCTTSLSDRLWISFSSCLLAEDWELYDDRPPLDGTFGSAMTALCQGHKVRRSTVSLMMVRGVVKNHTHSNFIPTEFDIKATDWKYAD